MFFIPIQQWTTWQFTNITTLEARMYVRWISESSAAISRSARLINISIYTHTEIISDSCKSALTHYTEKFRLRIFLQHSDRNLHMIWKSFFSQVFQHGNTVSKIKVILSFKGNLQKMWKISHPSRLISPCCQPWALEPPPPDPHYTQIQIIASCWLLVASC